MVELLDRDWRGNGSFWDLSSGISNLLYHFEVCYFLSILECDHSFLLDSFLASDTELGIMELLASLEHIHLLYFYTIESLEGIFDVDLRSTWIHDTGVDTTYLTIGRLIGDDESFDDGVERVHNF